MPELASFTPFLLAQAARGAGDSPGMYYWLSFAAIPLLFYFMILRPSQLQDRQRKQMLTALKKNDRVLTEAGIYGTVVSIDPETDKVVLRVDDDRGVKLTFIRSKVVRVLEAAPEKEKPAEAG
jgi:preprotein translocase subunit YajC